MPCWKEPRRWPILFIGLQIILTLSAQAQQPEQCQKPAEQKHNWSSDFKDCFSCLQEMASPPPKRVTTETHPEVGPPLAPTDIQILESPTQLEDLSEKWLMLLSTMAHQCSPGEPDHFFLQTFSFWQKFGACSSDSYEFQELEEKTQELVKKWARGEAKMDYADSPENQNLFQTVYDLSYSTAFFYFCQLPQMSPEKKLARLGRYDSYTGDTFRLCAENALTQIQGHQTCQVETFYRAVGPPLDSSPSPFAISLFSLEKNHCRVIREGETDTHQSLQFVRCASQEINEKDNSPPFTPSDKSELSTDETSPHQYPTQYPEKK